MTRGRTVALRAAALTEWLLGFENDVERAEAWVLGEIGEGRGLIEIAEDCGLGYGDIAGWFRLNQERSRRLDAALSDRRERDGEEARGYFRGVVGDARPSGVPSVKDRLRAAENLSPRVRLDGGGAVVADFGAGLIGLASEILAARRGRVVAARADEVVVEPGQHDRIESAPAQESAVPPLAPPGRGRVLGPAQAAPVSDEWL